MPTSHEPVNLKQIDVDKLKSVVQAAPDDAPGRPGRETMRSFRQDRARISMSQASGNAMGRQMDAMKKREKKRGR